MQPERRKARRFELEARIWCEGPNCVLYVNILNASTGGLFVKTSTAFHLGDALKLRWRFSGEDADSKATGVVAWRRCHAVPTEYDATVGCAREHQPGAGMGVKFTDLPAATDEALEKLETGAR